MFCSALFHLCILRFSASFFYKVRGVMEKSLQLEFPKLCDDPSTEIQMEGLGCLG